MKARLLAPFVLAALGALSIALSGAYLVAGALHARPTLVSPLSITRANESAASTHSAYREVEIPAAGGARLRAWLFLPTKPHPDYVILLHGLGDTRAGMYRLARMLLNNGYAVLAPDSRGQGESSGPLVTYGVFEAPDVRLWACFLFSSQPVRNLYGLGESLGAAVLLQSLPLEPRFQAVVADSPFSSFEAIAHDRVQQNLQSDSFAVRALAIPVVSSGLFYARWRYGIDLTRASPEDAIRRASTPVLLIHGLRDVNISPQHSRTLLWANPRIVVPWFVPKAGHSGAYAADPAAFEQRVVSFLQSHRR